VLAVVTVLYGCGMVCVLLRECGSGKRENLGKERPPKQYPPLAASQCRRRIVPDLAHNIIIIISMTKG
jgi:hypothetical protein